MKISKNVYLDTSFISCIDGFSLEFLTFSYYKDEAHTVFMFVFFNIAFEMFIKK